MVILPRAVVRQHPARISFSSSSTTRCSTRKRSSTPSRPLHASTKIEFERYAPRANALGALVVWRASDDVVSSTAGLARFMRHPRCFYYAHDQSRKTHGEGRRSAERGGQ